jgi:hypothetical protein
MTASGGSASVSSGHVGITTEITEITEITEKNSLSGSVYSVCSVVDSKTDDAAPVRRVASR